MFRYSARARARERGNQCPPHGACLPPRAVPLPLVQEGTNEGRGISTRRSAESVGTNAARCRASTTHVELHFNTSPARRRRVFFPAANVNPPHDAFFFVSFQGLGRPCASPADPPASDGEARQGVGLHPAAPFPPARPAVRRRRSLRAGLLARAARGTRPSFLRP